MTTSTSKLPFLKSATGFFVLAAMLLLVQPALAEAPCGEAGATSWWTPWECVLEVSDSGAFLQGRKAYLARLRVEFSAPGLPKRVGYAAWDGKGAEGRQRFVIRQMFPPGAEAAAIWTFATFCETPAICGPGTSSPALETRGQVVVSPYSGENPLQRLGPLVREDRTWTAAGGGKRRWGFLRQAGGGAFSWVGDSAWAAPMEASEAEWAAYLADRRSRGVTVVQLGPAPGWAGETDAAGLPPFARVGGCGTRENVAPTPCEVPKVEFWRSFEKKIAMANEAGIYVLLAGVMEPHSFPPARNRSRNYPSENEAINFAHWLAARLSGSFTILSPGFDSPLFGKKGQNLQTVVGRELARTAPRQPVTNHWATLELEETTALHGEPWLAFELFQSGHNNGDLAAITRRAREMAAQVSGSSEPAVPPFGANIKPAINGEGVYDHGGVPKETFSDYRQRQAGYLSWLSGAAGYSFGTGGIWDWGLCGKPANDPANPCGYQLPEGWRDPASALRQPSGESLRWMAQLMASVGGAGFDAAEQGRIRGQEGLPEERKMALARSPQALLAYLPDNPAIEILLDGAAAAFNPHTARLYDPRTGIFESVAAGGELHAACSGGGCRFTNRFQRPDQPEAGDRVLVLSPLPRRTGAGERLLEVFSGRLAAGQPWGVNGRLLDAAGRPAGEPFAIAAATGSALSAPVAARDGQGDFLVVWRAAGEDGQRRGIFGRRVKASGEPEGDAFRISPPSGREIDQPAVALAADGTAIAVWRSIDPVTGNGEVWGRETSRTGELGSPYAIAAGKNIDAGQPKAALDPSGELAVAWSERDTTSGAEDIKLRHYGSARLSADNAAPPAQRVNAAEAPMFWLLGLDFAAPNTLELICEARFGPKSGGVLTRTFSRDGKIQ